MAKQSKSKKVGMLVVKLGNAKYNILPFKDDIECFTKLLKKAIKGTEWGTKYDFVVYSDLLNIEVFKY